MDRKFLKVSYEPFDIRPISLQQTPILYSISSQIVYSSPWKSLSLVRRSYAPGHLCLFRVMAQTTYPSSNPKSYYKWNCVRSGDLRGQEHKMSSSSNNKLMVHMYIVKNTTIFLIVRLLLIRYNYMFRPSMYNLKMANTDGRNM